MGIKQDYSYIWQCTQCDFFGELDTYTNSCECLQCHSQMILIEIIPKFPFSELESVVVDLLALRKKGDLSAKIILDLLAESPNPDIRNIVEKVLAPIPEKQEKRAEFICKKSTIRDSFHKFQRDTVISISSDKKNEPELKKQIYSADSTLIKHGMPHCKKLSSNTCTTSCYKCGMLIDYPDSISGMTIFCPACIQELQTPGKIKNTCYEDCDKSRFTIPKGALVYWDKKNNQFVSSPQEYFQLIKDNYHEHKTKTCLIAWGIFLISICCLFPLDIIHGFSFLHAVVLLVGLIISIIAYQLIRYDIVRDLLPLLKYKPDSKSTPAFMNFMSSFFELSKKVSVCDNPSKKEEPYEYTKQSLSSGQAVLAYNFSGNVQMLVYPDLAVLLYNNDFQIIGLHSIDLRILEKMDFSSHITDYDYHWLHSRIDGGPDRRYKNNYQIKTPRQYGIDVEYSYDCQLVVDGIYFRGSCHSLSLVNSLISQWNSSLF